MSTIEYNSLLFQISRRLDELNVHEQLVFMCRNYLASGSEDINIHDVMSLFKALEDRNYLGTDRLAVMKNLLKNVKEWALFEKVKMFESKRKEYKGLLEQSIRVLDEINDLERLISICRVEIPEESLGNIHDVRSLFKELENSSCLEIDCLEILKEILTETEQQDLLKEVEEFEERRNREDEFESRKAQASAIVSSVGSTLIGVLNIKTVFKVVAGGLIIASNLGVLSCGATFDQRVAAVDRCVLPASTKLLAITEGCVCLTVQALNITAVNTLWSMYQDGTLKERLQTFFVTDEIRELAGGEDVEVIVTIEEQEYEKACTDLTKIGLGIDGWEKKQPMKLQRRNSDSNLYCKAQDNEGTTIIQAEQLQPVTKQNKYIDPERLAYVQSYLEKAEDADSITTETSDSGMPGTHGTPSELGMEETKESIYNPLCLKDVSEEMVAELTGRLESDPVAQKQFYQIFGLDPKKIPDRRGLRDIRDLFPYTPLKLLKDAFEALQFFDLVELLEKEKRRTLRPALSLKEMENISNESNRPIKYYSKVEVLIIDNGKTAADRYVRAFGSFFKSINLESKIALISTKSTGKKPGARKKRMIRQSKVLESLPKIPFAMSDEYESRLKRDLKEIEYWKEETAEKPIEEEIEQQTEWLHNVTEKLQIAVSGPLSAVMDKWIHNKDKKSTIFAVLESQPCPYSPLVESNADMIKECLLQKLALIPDATKIVVTTEQSQIKVIPEALQVAYRGNGEILMSTMLELLSKRWQTLDLISVMHELGRTLNFELHPFLPSRRYIPYRTVTCAIHDSLSCRPKLQKTGENSNPLFNSPS